METLKIKDAFSNDELKFTEFIDLVETTAKNIRAGLSRFNTIRKADVVTDWNLFIDITEDSREDIFEFLPVIEDVELKNAPDLVKPLANVTDKLYDYHEWLSNFQDDYAYVDHIRHEEANKLLTTYNNLARALVNSIEKDFLIALKKHVATIIELKRVKYEKANKLQKAVTALTSELEVFDKISQRVYAADGAVEVYSTIINKTVTVSGEYVDERKLLTEEITKYRTISTELIPKMRLLENDIKAYKAMLDVLELDIKNVAKDSADNNYFNIMVVDLLKKLREYNTTANKLLKTSSVIDRLYASYQDQIKTSVEKQYNFILTDGMTEILLDDYGNLFSHNGTFNLLSKTVISMKSVKYGKIFKARVFVNGLLDLQTRQSVKPTIIVHDIHIDNSDNYQLMDQLKDEAEEKIYNVEWKIEMRRKK